MKTIDLLFVASKQKLYVEGLEKNDETFFEDQFGFRKNPGTREAIFALIILIEFQQTGK